MKNLLFVELNSVELYIDQVLVDYDGAPVFFTCIDKEGKYYAVICSDFDDEEYLLASTTLQEIARMLRGKDTMRDFIQNGSKFWKIFFKNGKIVGKAIEIGRNEIDEDSLPIKGECLLLANAALKKYADVIESRIYSNSVWLSMKGVSVRVGSEYEMEPSVNLHMPISVNYHSIFKGMCKAYVRTRMGNDIFCDMRTTDIMYALATMNNKKVASDMNALVVEAA